ncbi:hypothetical protein RB596_006177 [Gaeumannomyces avenae]
MPFGIIDAKHDGSLPGTELLIGEEGGDMVPEDEARQLKRVVINGEEIILVPQPNDADPNDPVLWPRWKKEAAFWVIFFNTVMFAIVPGPMLAPQTFSLSKTFGTSLTAIAELSGYQLLVVGAIGPLVSVLAQKYGKRPQFLFAAVMGCVGTAICIAGARELDYHLLLGGRMVQGLGMTAWESLSVAAVGDLFYLHERGWRTALLVAALTCSSSMVAVVSGVMSQSVGWQNLFVASLPIDLVCLATTIFLVPESQYRRPATLPDRGGGGGGDEAAIVAPEKGGATSSSNHENGGDGVHDSSSGGGPAAVAHEVPLKTFAQSIAAFSGNYTDKGIGHLLVEIFVHLVNPAVVWILLVSGVLISFYVAAAYMTAQIWSPPPYLLNVAQNGYFYSGAFIGGVLAVSAGPVCDWSARVLARLNRGVFEAEFRILINVLSALCCSLGWFLWMWVMEHPRKEGVFIAAFCYGLVGFGIAVSSTSAGLYILDSFPNQSTEVFVLQMMVKNFMFYAFSTFVNTWSSQKGSATVFRTFGIVTLCLLSTCIPMYIFGKLNRRFISQDPCFAAPPTSGHP